LKHSLVPDSALPILSADYRAFESMLRMRPLVNYDPLANPITIAKKIRSTAKLGTLIPKPSYCQVNKEIFDHDVHTMDTYWVDYFMKKFQKHSDKLLLLLHGRGYVYRVMFTVS
jgi:hypothetical protein